MRGTIITALLLVAFSASAQEPKPCGCSCPADDETVWQAAIAIQSPDAGRVSVDVVYDDPSPLPGVTVSLEKSDVRYEQVTDAAGHADFFNVLPGEYRLRADLEGFKSVTVRSVAVSTGAIATAALRMKVDPSQMVCIDCDGGSLPAFLDPGTFVITRRMMDELPLP